MWFLFVMLFLTGLVGIGGGSVGTYIGYSETDARFIGFGISLMIAGVLIMISALVILTRTFDGHQQSVDRRTSSRMVQTDAGVVTRLTSDETILLVTMRKLHSQGRLKLVYERSASGASRAVYLDGKPLVSLPNESSNREAN